VLENELNHSKIWVVGDDGGFIALSILLGIALWYRIIFLSRPATWAVWGQTVGREVTRWYKPKFVDSYIVEIALTFQELLEQTSFQVEFVFRLQMSNIDLTSKWCNQTDVARFGSAWQVTLTNPFVFQTNILSLSFRHYLFYFLFIPLSSNHYQEMRKGKKFVSQLSLFWTAFK